MYAKMMYAKSMQATFVYIEYIEHRIVYIELANVLSINFSKHACS